jgi:hypothetical protein
VPPCHGEGGQRQASAALPSQVWIRIKIKPKRNETKRNEANATKQAGHKRQGQETSQKQTKQNRTEQQKQTTHVPDGSRFLLVTEFGKKQNAYSSSRILDDIVPI